MLHVVCKHYRSARSLAKQLRFNPIQTGLFFASLDRGGGGLRRPYPCNAATAYCMTPQFTPNDVVIISSI